MKKFLISLFILLVTACSNNQENPYNSQNDNEQNLESSLSSKYEFKSITCDKIKDKIDAIETDTIYINGKTYRFNPNQLFSNNQNCIEIENADYDKLIFSDTNGVILEKNDILFHIVNNDGNYTRVDEFDEDASFFGVFKIAKALMNFEGILGYTLGNDGLYVLKEDGNVYLFSMKWNDNSSTYTVKDLNKIVYNFEDYGKIKYIYHNSNFNKTDENLVLYTENGLYNIQDIETEECLKYADISCKREIIKISEFDKFKDEIIYFDRFQFIDNKLNVYNSSNFIDLKYFP